MILPLTTQEGESIEYSPDIPRSYKHLSIQDADNLYAAGRFGAMAVAEIRQNAFSIRYSHYFIKRRISLQGAADLPVLELQLAMLSRFRYHQEGIGNIRLEEGQFNMVYAPLVRNESFFDKGRYTFFDVQFSIAYLQAIELYFPILTDFLRRTKQEIPGLLRPANTLAAGDMVNIVHRILYNEYVQKVRDIYIEAKVMELLVTALSRVIGNKIPATLRLRPYDVQKIHESRSYLEEHMSETMTTLDLAHAVGMNEFKLKRGFRQLYGITPYEYLLDIRMEKARVLLSEGKATLMEIALAIGYKNMAGFTTAFKKKMGYPPGREGGIRC